MQQKKNINTKAIILKVIPVYNTTALHEQGCCAKSISKIL